MDSGPNSRTLRLLLLRCFLVLHLSISICVCIAVLKANQILKFFNQKIDLIKRKNRKRRNQYHFIRTTMFPICTYFLITTFTHISSSCSSTFCHYIYLFLRIWEMTKILKREVNYTLSSSLKEREIRKRKLVMRAQRIWRDVSLKLHEGTSKSTVVLKSFTVLYRWYRKTSKIDLRYIV